ncbi:MAG: hypothetical protein V4561_10735 [Bacteroidota bacterium]
MKKYFLLFAAGGLLTLASCGGETTPTETVNVDSLAQVKVDSIAAAQKAVSDSTIAAQAQATADSLRMVMRDDSIIAATKAAGKKVPAKKVVVKKATQVVKEETATPKPGGLRGSSDQNTQGGLRSNSDQNKQSGGLRSNSDQNKDK